MNGKKDDSGKNDKIVTDGRNGTNEYRHLDPPSHFVNFFVSQTLCKKANVVRASSPNYTFS